MGTRTTEQIFQKYCQSLGAEFGSTYYHARNEWCDLWLTWKQYENLFGHGPERVALMNSSGSGFFYRVDRYFFDAVALAVCRLSDPVESAGKPNLTLMLFQSYMDTDERKRHINNLLDAVSKTTEFARDWRNRRISHNDYNLKIGTAEPLRAASRVAMNSAIDSLYQVLAYVSVEYMDTHLDNEVIDEWNNEMVMLNRLFLGTQVHERELEEFRSGFDRAKQLPDWLVDS